MPSSSVVPVFFSFNNPYETAESNNHKSNHEPGNKMIPVNWISKSYKNVTVKHITPWPESRHPR